MVAEPVQATVQTLQSLLHQTTDFINTQSDRIQSKYHDQIFFEPKSNPVIQVRPRVQQGFMSSLYRVISKNKTAMILGIGLGIAGGVYFFMNWPRDSHTRRRRVSKLTNGGRTDVVLLIGSPTEPLTRAIALDFDKRGFIVYLTILDSIDAKYISSHPLCEDINYLDFTHGTIEDNLLHFKQVIKAPAYAFPGAHPHRLRLKSIIFAPSLFFPIGPIENVGVNTWQKLSDRFMMYLKLLSGGLIQLVRSQAVRVISICPNNLSALNVAYNGPESVFQNQLKSLFTVLSKELKQHGVFVTQVKLGNVCLSHQKLGSNSRIESLVNTEVRAWTSEMRELYSSDFVRSQYVSNRVKGSGGHGKPAKELFHLLYDLTYSKRPPTIAYCGKGARWYEYIARGLPHSWITFLF
ncbi:uncharacterized protein LODBEIA_P14910 [Lodderomyces beijingensis]|uniref:DUF1776-domain-containing protein n=1 Tax=Lodderomyces beijingensis TaxID=1775926 RepID=A0ABP0ZIJ2_9ASCO